MAKPKTVATTTKKATTKKTWTTTVTTTKTTKTTTTKKSKTMKKISQRTSGLKNPQKPLELLEPLKIKLVHNAMQVDFPAWCGAV